MNVLLMLCLFFSFIFYTHSLSLLDIHQAQAPMSTYLNSNFHKEEVGEENRAITTFRMME